MPSWPADGLHVPGSGVAGQLLIEWHMKTSLRQARFLLGAYIGRPWHMQLRYDWKVAITLPVRLSFSRMPQALVDELAQRGIKNKRIV